jgi:hypothetical protein
MESVGDITVGDFVIWTERPCDYFSECIVMLTTVNGQ